MNELKLIKIEDERELVELDSNGNRLCSAYIYLDLSKGILYAKSTDDSDGITSHVYYGTTQRFPVGVIGKEAANEVLGKVLPLAKAIYDSSEISYDDNLNPMLIVEDVATSALASVEQVLERYQDDDYTYQANEDWFDEALGCDLTALVSMNDDELKQYARTQSEAAISDGVVLYDVEDYLREIRQKLIDE